MQRGQCRLFFSFIVLTVLGCTFEPVRMSSVGGQIGSCLVDLEQGLVHTSTRDGGTESSVTFGYADFKVDMPPQVRMSYNPLSGIFKNVGITGRFPNGTDYFVRIDSGFPWYVGVTDTVVADQKLAGCFLNDSPIPMGICELKSLAFDKLTVTSPPCLYFQQHWELQMLGLPVWKERAVLIGLNLMEQFSYILFDNQLGEIEFGRKDTFFDPVPEAWQSYPISLLDDPQGQYRLQVDIPVAGENLNVWFDTGNPGELELSSGLWSKVASRFDAEPPQKSIIQYWQFGNVECEKILVHNLTAGRLEPRNVELIVLPEGKPFYENYASIGMGFFKEDVLVLDFHRKLLWVKQR